ncbi:Sucrase/ferredoxin-like-domain-containing protein [Aspergillus taichungensis]|uniref:Sucrase/ferredoxin-like-domain-containing protein n=1 Tax=Aspergillus taichungensis TaxID=482145 RepID=A0A2J5HT61_9EURO|nr:Sucrase/ferredoxin-like-domain-containing protein [Aspergillus taichungensis]
MFQSLLSLRAVKSNTNYIFPTVNPKEDGPDCQRDCADCTVHFPSKVKIETSKPLYGKTKEFHCHVLVATGRSDWNQHAEQEKGSLMEAFDQSAYKSRHGRIMVSASNLQPADNDDTADNQTMDKGTTVLLLPSFTFVDSVTNNDVQELIDSFIDAPQSQSQSGTNPPSTEQQIVRSRLTSRPCAYEYVILLCSHKRRDARCGITAPLIKKELERHLRPRGLYRDANDERPGGVGIFFVSHVGGHKFSANVLIYRKKEQQMIWLARVKPEHCEGVVNYTLLQGKVVHPETQLRGGFDRQRRLTSW